MADAAKQLREQGAALFQESKYEDALAKFSGALALINTLSSADDKDIQATKLSCLLNSASCCVKMSKLPDAVEYANAALQVDSKSAKALYRRGQARRMMKEFSKARIDLVMAMEIKDDDAIREELRLLREEQAAAGPSAQSRPPTIDALDMGRLGGGGGRGPAPPLPSSGFDDFAALSAAFGQAAARSGGAAATASSTSKAAPAPVKFDPSTLSGPGKALFDAAEGGDAPSQVKLGDAFEEGKIGLPKSPAHAFKYYKMAADQGSADGQNCLAWCYKTGFGTTKDLVKAFAEYQKCAAQGHKMGMANLGFCFEKGEGTTENLPEAAIWYTKAAEVGSSVAQVNLALMYEKGRGVATDAAKALELYHLAGAQGNPNANINVGLYYEKGIVVAKDMTEAFKYYMKAAETGDHTGQTIVGCCFENGEGVAKDTERALDFYMRAARQGNGHAREGLKRITGYAQ